MEVLILLNRKLRSLFNKMLREDTQEFGEVLYQQS